ncbi:PIN-like domain-containing protein [Pseudoalteromonas piscicida]|uniref:PIN-like domain-containing protein n=1 Tax=Pseudoalteromonas piscicida TaxID=43662 RepID=UPI0027389846|nr:PIN-like domain-containing protein [Pseudoalteromonas piscicida]MDP4490138.1 PIN-like domain-containing protein [Pseudoalteromonas piscicida]
MKDIFAGFYQPSDDELHLTWNKCTFVFDSNVLLSLYRRPQTEQTEILNAIESVSERVWISYQAALDYQRNLPIVKIIEEKKYLQAIDEIRKLKAKLKQITLPFSSYSSASPIATSLNVGNRSDAFFDDLTKEIEALTPLALNDLDNSSLTERIDKLFKGKVGSPPQSQDELNKSYELANTRYKNRMPPGYLDTTKKATSYSYGGLVYNPIYSDYISWEQIVQYAKIENKEHIIFVTDDVKSDWWHISNGKRVGPRPELVDEIGVKADVSGFHMYDSEQFIESISNYMDSPLSKSLVKKLKLEKAELFLNVHKEKQAAVMAVGTALEKHLKDLCESNGIDIMQTNKDGSQSNKKADRLNSELYKKSVYSLVYQKSITAWLDIRNAGAHANDEDYSESQVQQMIVGVSEFFEKYPT